MRVIERYRLTQHNTTRPHTFHFVFALFSTVLHCPFTACIVFLSGGTSDRVSTLYHPLLRTVDIKDVLSRPPQKKNISILSVRHYLDNTKQATYV